MITVLIPAHNERESIKATVESVKTQTLPANRIIVVTDNCSDDTAAIAGGAGATVMASVGNKGKKAVNVYSYYQAIRNREISWSL